MALVLTEADVRRALPMAGLIPAMEATLVAFSEGRTRQPLRTVLEVGPDRAFFGVMPACLPERPALGAKIVTLFARNAERHLPTHLATILLFDHETGALLAIMDGRYITEARTAAVSAVSVRHLARPDARMMGILGSGVQARSHLEAFAQVRSLERVRVYSPDAGRRRRFAGEMERAAGIAIEAVGSPEAAVRGADIVLVAATVTAPVLHDAWVAEGAHVVSIGAARPDQRELEPVLVSRARVIVDSREAALAESGDVVMGLAERHFDRDHIAGELGEVVSGRVRGRTSPTEITLFKSLGLAVEDVAAADLARRTAGQRQIGRILDL